jgi:Fe-S cluster biogenesis protein NfuA
MDEAAVDEAVEELGAMLRADGAELTLVDADAKRARVEVALDLTGVECLDCVLPPEFLEQMLTESLARRIRGEFELVLRDPRRDA